MNMLNPIIALIHNVTDDTWHPVVFREARLPGGVGGNLTRHKSKVHHTAGFSTKEAAILNAEEELKGQMEEYAVGEVRMELDAVFPWDGKGVPTMAHFFGVKAMTKDEFKKRWESNDEGGGITFDDIADCAVAWGLYDRPKINPILEVKEAVYKAAGLEGAEA